MQEALFEAGVAPSSTLSFIGSTQATIEALFAVPISRLVAAYGPRRVAIVGSILAGLGPILAGSCSHSVAGLIITEVSRVFRRFASHKSGLTRSNRPGLPLRFRSSPRFFLRRNSTCTILPPPS